MHRLFFTTRFFLQERDTIESRITPFEIARLPRVKDRLIPSDDDGKSFFVFQLSQSKIRNGDIGGVRPNHP